MLPAKRKNLFSQSPPGSPANSNKRQRNERNFTPQPGNVAKGKEPEDGGTGGGGGGGGGGAAGPDDEAEEDDAVGMEDDDYTAQLNWQSQSKENVNSLLGKFSEEQSQRYAVYRRSAINRNTVRKFIHHQLGTNPSLNVAQMVAGLSKVFVGEMIEKARQVQTSQGESGPLAPDHLRQAYRMYAQQTGAVGAAKPHRGKRLFVR